MGKISKSARPLLVLIHAWSKVASCATHCSIWSGHLQFLQRIHRKSHSLQPMQDLYDILYYIIYICESSPFCKESSWFEASGCGTSARPHIHIAPAKEKIENEDQHDQNQNHRYPQTSTDLRSSKLFKVVQCTHKGNRLAQREHDLIQALVVMVDHQGLASIGI